MSIQTIIDRASAIAFDRRRISAQSISRSQRVKTSERAAAQPMQLTVTPPAMMRYSQSRQIIEAIQTNDKVVETQINLANNPKLSYITAYQGELTSGQTTAMTITNFTATTVTIGGLPSIGATLTSRTVNLTAKSFADTVAPVYNKALSTSRTDFLITDAAYDADWQKIKVGDVLSAATYITGSQTISSITRNYITIQGTGFTRIVMSAAPNASSPDATFNDSANVTVADTFTTYVSAYTQVFLPGDFIQPVNSRYPYIVTNTVTRGTNTVVTATVHRPAITSEAISLVTPMKIGNSCTFQMIVATLPTYRIVPYDLMEWRDDFVLFEKII